MNIESATNESFLIKIAKSEDISDFNQIRVLTSQLAPDYKPPGDKTIKYIITSNDYELIIAVNKSDSNQVVGLLIVCVVRLLTSTKIQIEDVVVDTNYRRKGIATEMLKTAITYSEHIGASKIDLTSTPDKIQANKLYKKLGFELKNTNVYRLNL